MANKKISELLSLDTVGANLQLTVIPVLDTSSGTTRKVTLQQLNDSIEANIPFAAAAFTQANTPSQVANSASSYANASFSRANTPSHVANSASSYANSAFGVANTANTNSITSGTYANAAYVVANTADQRAVTSGTYANAAYVVANTADQRAVTSGVYANAAFIRANNSLDANVGGIVTGNVTVTQNLTVTGNISVSGNLFTSIPANGNTSAYATKYLVEYNPVSREFSYSSTPNASNPYITGYSQEIHVSPVAFNDSGKGTIGDPVKTIARALELIAPAFETTSAGQRKTIILHAGDYAENVTINTQYTVLTTHELIGKNTTLTGTLTLATGCSVEGLKMTNLVISGTSANGSVDIVGCTVSTATTKTSNAYTVFRDCDLSSSTLGITGGGTVVMVGGNYFSVTVNNAAASVLAKAVVSMGPVTLTAGTMQIADTLVYALTNTANAITQSVGSILTLNNSQTLIPDLSNVARNSFGGYYSILHSVYDKANSTFGGTSLSAIDYSQFINADKVTLSSGGSLVFPDSTIQITAAAPFAYANAAYGQANTSNTLAQQSYNTANTKVSKSGDTMTGDLKFGGGGGIFNMPTNQIAITANVDNDFSGFFAQATGISTVYANTDVTIQANTGGAVTSVWTFSSTGSLTLPREGKIYGIGQGTASDRLGYISWAGNTSGDGLGFNTMRLVPDQQGLEDLDQYIILDPTSPGHIHIRAGGTQDNSQAFLYFGGENSHVKIDSGPNPGVTVMANNKSWSFGTNGNLTFPNSNVQTGAAISITELKALVANCATYGDFQTAIANL